MTDIVERLRSPIPFYDNCYAGEMVEEAADEIELLRRQRNRLLREMRKALHYCKDDMPRMAAACLLDAIEVTEHETKSAKALEI